MNSAAKGFTLVELLVAVAISVVLGVIAYVGLANAYLQFGIAEESLERLSQLQYAMRRLEQDITQIHPRPARDPLGDTPLPSVMGNEGTETAMVFTRGGWPNPLGLPRGSLQRVAYMIEDETLIRRHWSVVDATLANEPIDMPLLEGVLQVVVRYLDGAREWKTEWPALDADPESALRDRPLAIEVTVELEDMGLITRIFEVSG